MPEKTIALIAHDGKKADIVACATFNRDKLMHPHDPDIQTLLRTCNVHNLLIATNVATADLIISDETL